MTKCIECEQFVEETMTLIVDGNEYHCCLPCIREAGMVEVERFARSGVRYGAGRAI